MGNVQDASQTMPKSMKEREGWYPLAERGRLVVSAKKACNCEKAGTRWLNVGCVGTESFHCRHIVLDF